MPRKEGQFIVEDYLAHVGGLNSADSPFIVQPTQATDGYNWDYTTRGAITKRSGHTPLNTTSFSTQTTLGLGLYDSPSARYVIRAGDTGLQNVGNLGESAVTLTTLVEDTTAAGSTPFTTTFPVCFAMGNTTQSSALWAAGGGLTNLVGALNDTTYTLNGVPQATLTTFSIATTTAEVGYIAGPCYLTYSFSLVKASTGAEGNCLPEATEAADTSVFVPYVQEGTTTTFATSAVVHIKAVFTTIDTTKYVGVNVYKSQPTTASSTQLGTPDSGFTAGVLMGQIPTTSLASGTTIYITDFGQDTAPPGVSAGWAYSSSSYPSTATTAYTDTSANVPRAGNIQLDQSPLPSGRYESCVVWNGRLVTCSGNTVYVSDTEKFEAWPLTNIFTVPSGGPITALGVVGLSSGVAGVGINEALCIFKDRELWTLIAQGAPFDYTTWQFAFMGSSGCPSQRLVVSTDQGIVWINYRGIFSWNGASKPLYLSQPLEDKFAVGGDINVGALGSGWGQFYQQKKQVIWCISSNTYGTNQYFIKLDVRLTSMQTNGALTEAITHGIFSPDIAQSGASPSYAGMNAGLCFTIADAPTQEYLYMGDSAGYLYQGYSGVEDNDTAVSLEYVTPYLTMGTPGMRKRFNKVVVWVQDVGEPTMQLDYCSDWKALTACSTAENGSTELTSSPGVWDVSLWDQAVWGPAPLTVTPVVFLLNSQNFNNSEGCNLRLRLKDSSASYTPTIYGYSVYYTEVGTNF